MIDEDLSYCPHCDSRVRSEREGPNRITPDYCDNGCHQFYDQSDCLVATDQEAACGWWMGEDVTESNVVVSERDAQRIAKQRSEARIVQDRKDAEAAAFLARREAQQRYIDEALF